MGGACRKEYTPSYMCVTVRSAAAAAPSQRMLRALGLASGGGDQELEVRYQIHAAGSSCLHHGLHQHRR